MLGFTGGPLSGNGSQETSRGEGKITLGEEKDTGETETRKGERKFLGGQEGSPDQPVPETLHPEAAGEDPVSPGKSQQDKARTRVGQEHPKRPQVAGADGGDSRPDPLEPSTRAIHPV